MLSYEMCKRLSEAGYPQDISNYAIANEYTPLAINTPEWRAAVPASLACPSLEELLGEIVKFINKPRQVLSLLYCERDRKWRIDLATETTANSVGAYTTAIEAAAELWLKLREVQDA